MATRSPCGTLRGDQIELNLRPGTGRSLRFAGPVVVPTADGRITLHANGVLLGNGARPRGHFTLRGSDAALPEGTLPDPRAVPRVIAAGTTLVPTQFHAAVRRGPNAGMALEGRLSLGRVAADGTFAGTLEDPNAGTVPVSGRIAGGSLQLTFDLGPLGEVGGVGPYRCGGSGRGVSI